MEANIADWFKAFFALSDDGTAAHERYTTFYANDAKLIMGDKTAVGRDGMLPPKTKQETKIATTQRLTGGRNPRASQGDVERYQQPAAHVYVVHLTREAADMHAGGRGGV
ncbi:hypothetical protein V493_03130 [Pseudogymnoascus sp. VKM F-4281 (FW-2241)]|nr:hypothetical protein V493_03130 [Pseudogymnoascus sp. VKM F-4281 (FW-2241)]